MSYKIVVMSCDKNEDLWKPFYLCMEKYWKDHPEIIYSTETKINPYYKTICRDLPISAWTKRVYETCKDLECKHILLMVDDIFIRENVCNVLIETLCGFVSGGYASLNMEKCFDEYDTLLTDNILIRNQLGKYKTSVMCQLWQKRVLLELFNLDMTPWDFEKLNNGRYYRFLISRYGNFIKWGYDDRKWFGICKGKWCKETKEFFDKEGIEIDYSIRGFVE